MNSMHTFLFVLKEYIDWRDVRACVCVCARATDRKISRRLVDWLTSCMYSIRNYDIATIVVLFWLFYKNVINLDIYLESVRARRKQAQAHRFNSLHRACNVSKLKSYFPVILTLCGCTWGLNKQRGSVCVCGNYGWLNINHICPAFVDWVAYQPPANMADELFDCE